MEIRVNKRWVIFVPKNNCGIILGDIPEKMQDGVLNVSKLQPSRLKHYASIFGAVQSLIKYEILSSDATSILELESLINSTAQACQSAFFSEQMKVLKDEKIIELNSKIKALESQLKVA